MKVTAASEEEPFKERYEARGYLEICVAMTAGLDPKAVLTKALCHHKIGLINYEVEEIQASYDSMIKSLNLWQNLPYQLQYDHADTIQDVCNQIAIIHQNREKSADALEYLIKAEDYYKLEAPTTIGPEIIGEEWLKGERKNLE